MYRVGGRVKRHLTYYGSEILTQKAKPVSEFGHKLQTFVDEMFDVLGESRGIGLAAPQVGVSKQIIVVDLSSFDDGPRIALINPEIVWKSDETCTYDEGCLSVPGIYSDVIRPAKIKVKGYTIDGKHISFDADGVFARVLQHEIDHLNGKLFIEYLSPETIKEFSDELKKIKKLNKKKIIKK
jgi:peptide deformylase